MSFAHEWRFSRWRAGGRERGGGRIWLHRGPHPFSPFTPGPAPSLSGYRPSRHGFPPARPLGSALGGFRGCPRRCLSRAAANPDTCPPHPPQVCPPTAAGRWRRQARAAWVPGDQGGGGAGRLKPEDAEPSGAERSGAEHRSRLCPPEMLWPREPHPPRTRSKAT